MHPRLGPTVQWLRWFLASVPLRLILSLRVGLVVTGPACRSYCVRVCTLLFCVSSFTAAAVQLCLLWRRMFDACVLFFFPRSSLPFFSFVAVAALPFSPSPPRLAVFFAVEVTFRGPLFRCFLPFLFSRVVLCYFAGLDPSSIDLELHGRLRSAPAVAVSAPGSGRLGSAPAAVVSSVVSSVCRLPSRLLFSSDLCTRLPRRVCSCRRGRGDFFVGVVGEGDLGYLLAGVRLCGRCASPLSFLICRSSRLASSALGPQPRRV